MQNNTSNVRPKQVINFHHLQCNDMYILFQGYKVMDALAINNNAGSNLNKTMAMVSS